MINRTFIHTLWSIWHLSCLYIHYDQSNIYSTYNMINPILTYIMIDPTFIHTLWSIQHLYIHYDQSNIYTYIMINPTFIHALWSLVFIHTLCCTCSMKPLKAGRSEHRTISAHDLSVSQSEPGLGKGFSRAMPPVRRNLHSRSSTDPLVWGRIMAMSTRRNWCH